jgi:hypothetical protein
MGSLCTRKVQISLICAEKQRENLVRLAAKGGANLENNPYSLAPASQRGVYHKQRSEAC